MLKYQPLLIDEYYLITITMLQKILYYLNPKNLFKREEGADFNLRMMHGINKISILMFLACLVYMTFRYFAR